MYNSLPTWAKPSASKLYRAAAIRIVAWVGLKHHPHSDPTSTKLPIQNGSSKNTAVPTKRNGSHIAPTFFAQLISNTFNFHAFRACSQCVPCVCMRKRFPRPYPTQGVPLEWVYSTPWTGKCTLKRDQNVVAVVTPRCCQLCGCELR